MGFKNVIVQTGGGGGGSAAPTFIYNEQIRRFSGISIPKLAISESERRTDSIRVSPILTDTERRTDAYRIPSAQFAVSDSERRADAPQIPLLRVSDQAQRTDKTTVSVLFQASGTRNFVIPNGVSQMVMEAWGAGGAGGTATVNSGGGGKGGAYARRNAQAVTAGQTVTVTVAPSVAAAAGAASSVSVAGGQTSFSVPQNTFTYNATPGGLARPVGFSLLMSGSPVFKSGASAADNGSNVLTVPNGVSSGDIGVVIVVQSDVTSMQDDGYTLQATAIVSVNSPNIVCKVLTKTLMSDDSGKTYPAIERSWGYAVYSGGSGVEYFGSLSSGSNATTVQTPAFSSAINGLAILVTATDRDTSFNSNGMVNSVDPPAGVVERVTNTAVIGGSDTFSINDAVLTQTGSVGTTYVQAAGGNVGGNGSATAGGTGATGQNGTSTGDVTFTGGNGANGTLTAGGAGGGGAGSNGNATGATGAGQLGGNGGASAAAGSIYGGGGGGATTLAARGAGAQGAVRLTFTI